MTLQKYTHANLKTDIFVDLLQVYSVYYSEAHRATHLLAFGGAIIPVLEAIQTVKADIERTKNEQRSNGNI